MTLVLDVEQGRQPQYVYFGQRLNAQELQHLQAPRNGRMDAYPAYGMNCPADAALAMRHADGNMSTQLVVTGVERLTADEGQQTEITMKDPVYPITVKLCYLAYQDVDMITTWTEVTNQEKQPVALTTFASAVLPIRRGDVWMSSFYGSWANEGRLVEEPLTPGQKQIVNKDGTRNAHTSHGEVMFSLNGKAQENQGQVIGAALCYSGNYRLKVVTDDTDYHYFFAGINEDNSEYHLKKG
jgi:alpha-galactosidase